MHDEEWRPIPSWPHHEVSSHGRARSVDHLVATGIKNHTHRLIKGRILHSTANEGGYHRVGGRYLHHLVLEAFVGPRPPGLVGCHEDGDHDNNSPSNLRWDTYAANEADKLRHGRNHQASKKVCKRGHELVEPNLDPYQLSKGHRLCRACKNGHQMAFVSTPCGPERRALVQEAADRAYIKIMGVPT